MIYVFWCWLTQTAEKRLLNGYRVYLPFWSYLYWCHKREYLEVIGATYCYCCWNSCIGALKRTGLLLSIKRKWWILALHTHTRVNVMALFPGLPRWAGTRKAKPIWILPKQEPVSSSGISWAICKSAPCSRQTTTPAPHHSVFYRLDALLATQPTASKHWRLCTKFIVQYNL